jgi:hypothetical protein
MTGKEAKELIIKNATPYFETKGWQLKKVSRNEACFFKKEKEYSDSIGISTTDYNPEQLIGFGMGKRIEIVENIMNEINKRIPFSNPPYPKDEKTLNIIDKKDSLKREDKSYCTTENDIIYNLNKIFNYLDNYALPQLEKFNDIREIDRLINGEGNNFWEDDWQKPFNFAGRFYLRRLVIAKLSGRSDYEDFIEKRLLKIEKLSFENNETFDRNDLSKTTPFTIEYLKNIKPIY